MAFFEILSKLMIDNNIKAKQLSDNLKIGKNQIKYWKDNGNIPNGETLISLSNYFNCSVDYLLGLTDEPNLPINENNCSPKLNEQQQKLIDNYNILNSYAQKNLLDYSDFMTTKPENLKDTSDSDKIVS